MSFNLHRELEADYLICGGGIIGLTLARELVRHDCDNIIILEKEPAIGRHASGRNSGVLHAGIYYSSDTLKAKMCLKGNLLLQEYCNENGLPLLKSGKVIVARNESETGVVRELYERAVKNGASVELIDEEELGEIEPDARTCGLALYSHDTAVVDPLMILQSLYDELIATGKVKVLSGMEFKGTRGSNSVITNRGEVRFNTFINAAGAYSDKIAHHFGVALNYELIPFKGVYNKLSKERARTIKGSIYPVPDVRNPFLGIHFTRSIDGDVYIGPTAIPALGRENYGIFEGIGLESTRIIYHEAVLFCVNRKFRKTALSEPRKYFHSCFFNDARGLLKNLKSEDIESSAKSGIRPQLVDWKRKELVMDFLIIKDSNSIHILNAVSPAFTSSMAFAEYTVTNYVVPGAGHYVHYGKCRDITAYHRERYREELRL